MLHNITQSQSVANACQRAGLRLAPLAVCLPTVVAEFGRLARRWRLADCAPPAPAAGGGAGPTAGGLRPLEMFFPFDPYLLRRSAAVLDLKCGAAPPAGRAARSLCLLPRCPVGAARACSCLLPLRIIPSFKLLFCIALQHARWHCESGG